MIYGREFVSFYFVVSSLAAVAAAAAAAEAGGTRHPLAVEDAYTLFTRIPLPPQCAAGLQPVIINTIALGRPPCTMPYIPGPGWLSQLVTEGGTLLPADPPLIEVREAVLGVLTSGPCNLQHGSSCWP